MDKSSIIKTIPLFANLSRRNRSRIESWADDVEVPAGQVVIREGGAAHEFCVIAAGSAEVRRHGDRIAELGRGAFFGETGMLNRSWTHSETVVTTSSSRLLVFGRDAFREMLWELPIVADRVRSRADHDAELRTVIHRPVHALHPAANPR
jgi:CRP-like cAMP-binding protein